MLGSDLPAPFPWFGGKRKVADAVWQRFGRVANYVEPFFGSGAVLLGRPAPFDGNETINDLDGYVCVAPETRVLTKGLTYRPAGDLRSGDELLAFDEENPGDPPVGLRAPSRYRRWRHSAVIAAPRVKLPCYRLTFDDGTTVVVSGDHCWLAGSHKAGSDGRGWRWVKTKSLVCNRRTQRSWVLKVAPVVERDETWEAGWIGGLYDGEGSLVIGPGSRLILAQNAGPVMDQAKAWLRAHGFDLQNVRQDRKCEHVTIAGGLKETLRFLMLARPGRLVRKLHEHLDDLSLYGREHAAVGLVSKEFLGEQELIALSTTTRTFVAEGLASHNCNFWRAVKHAPEDVAEHADNPVNENDLHARHVWLLQKRETLQGSLEGDPDFYDAKIAGYWVWGLACWIGSGFCSGNGPWWVNEDRQLVNLGNNGRGVNRQLVHLGDNGRGVNRQRVHLGNNGQGVNRKIVHLGDNGRGEQQARLGPWFLALAERLARVRVCSGDWSRVCGPSVTFKHGLTAVFLDPPYADTAERTSNLYRKDSENVAHAVREWAIENGGNKLLCIALCGYEGEHEMPGRWSVYEWSAGEGFGAQAQQRSKNGKRERIWFSPACQASAQAGLFDERRQ